MATMDQVVWQTANVVVGGEHQAFNRGELLPEPATAEEANQRTLLRLGGAIRMVEVVYTAEELAEQAQQRGEATAQREAALDVDQSLPAGQQDADMEPGRATLVTPGGAPVVIGDEELRAEHQEQAEEADRTRQEQASQARRPGFTATRGDWVDYAVTQGADRAEAQGMTRDQLRRQYGAQPGDPAAATTQTRPGAGVQPSQSAAESPSLAAPGRDASEQEWRDYAVARGADPGQASGLSRDQLMAAYGSG